MNLYKYVNTWTLCADYATVLGLKVLSNEMGLTKSGSSQNTFGDTQTALPAAYTFTLVNVGNGTEKLLLMA
jgi:hypothetical protein